ncbi:helix-turn-helix domain-containing protein, partial [Helcococcus ovis]
MNKRQIMILQTIKLKDEYITAKSMSEIFGVSTKTIYKDIDKINEYIKQYDIKIEKLPRKGIKINDKYQIKKLFSILSNLDFNKNNDNKSIEFREEYLFKEILLNRKKLNVFDYEDNAYLSEGSARRDIKKFEKYLISKKIYLEKENGRFYVTGDEVNIRKTIKEYLYALIDNSNFEDIKT